MSTAPPKCQRCNGDGHIPDNGEGEPCSCPDCYGTGEGLDLEDDASYYERDHAQTAQPNRR